MYLSKRIIILIRYRKDNTCTVTQLKYVLSLEKEREREILLMKCNIHVYVAFIYMDNQVNYMNFINDELLQTFPYFVYYILYEILVSMYAYHWHI